MKNLRLSRQTEKLKSIVPNLHSSNKTFLAFQFLELCVDSESSDTAWSKASLNTNLFTSICLTILKVLELYSSNGPETHLETMITTMFTTKKYQTKTWMQMQTTIPFRNFNKRSEQCLFIISIKFKN